VEVPDPDPVVILTPPRRAEPSFIPNRKYYAVKEVRASGTPCRPLNKKSNAEGKDDGGFEQEGDERWGRNWNKFDIERGRNVSASFNPVTGVCGTCLTGVHPAWIGGGEGAIVLVLADHHFPANIPADGAEDCLRIFRVENGSVNEICDEFMQAAPKGKLPAGSVILLASASQLVYDSAEHYANEWKRCRNLLKTRFGESIVLPGLPLSGASIENRTVVRGLIDVGVWFSSMEEHELKFIRNTRKGWEDVYLGRGTTPSFSEGWRDRQEAIPKLNEAGERYWVTLMVEELNRELRFGLAKAVSVGRTLLAVRRQEQSVKLGRVATLGASNAGKTAAGGRAGGSPVWQSWLEADHGGRQGGGGGDGA
jgi:hypothetical protein